MQQERAFIGLSWIPKATVQAALGSAPLDLIREKMDPSDPHYDEWEMWGKEILVTAVLSILITAPIGLVCINYLGPRWLSKDTARRMSLDFEADKDSDETTVVTNLNEAWAINERNRREDENVVVLRKRTQVERFFGSLKEHIQKVKDTINSEEKALSASKENTTMLLSEIEALADAKPLLDADDKVSSSNKLSEGKINQLMAQLEIVDEGIEALYYLLLRNAESVPTSELFMGDSDHYQDIPTQDEIMRRLQGILKDESRETMRRSSFSEISSRLGSIIISAPPRMASRSFTWFKGSPSPNDNVEMI